MPPRRDDFYLIGDVARAQLAQLLHAYAIVYLVHFSMKIGNPDNRRAQAQHYLGWCTDLHSRMLSHYNGDRDGAKIMYAAFHEYRVTVTVARLWEGDWYAEKWLKGSKKLGFPGYKNAPLLCPECSPHGWSNRAVTPPIPPAIDQLPDNQPIPSTMDWLEMVITQEYRRFNIPGPSEHLDDDLL